MSLSSPRANVLALLALILAPACSFAASHDPGLRSVSALVLDESNDKVLYARAPDKALPIASITKLMMALVVLEAGQPLDEMLTINAEDQRRGRGAPSHLAPGTRLRRGELLHLALMVSENRAAYAVGRSYQGGVPAVVAAMNAKARSLGMPQTHFVDPIGISSDNVASARDLARLLSAAAANPRLREYSTDHLHSVQLGRRTIQYRNTNTLVGKQDWQVVVQKTGYLQAAGRCLIMQAVIDGRRVSMVFLNSFGKYTRVAEARRIRKWMEAAG